MNAASSGSGRRLDWVAPETALSAFADDRGCLLLSGGPHTPSYLFAGPADALPGHWPDAIDAARRALSRGARVAGLIDYDAGSPFETARPAAADPVLHLFSYRAWLRFDPASRHVALEGDADAGDMIAARLAARDPAGPAPLPGGGQFEPVWPKARYLEACRAVLDHIRAGDIYQTNLSQPFAGALAPGDTPLSLFSRLVSGSPASYGAYLRLSPDRVVMTNSPERFLRLEGGIAETRPIKGTRPRGGTPEADAALAAELGASAKDRAENLMIVDLMRHDLSRVCAPGSVTVPDLFRVESFANVHHLVSTVTGQLAEGRDALDLVAAAFPPGSITGAPKIRAMEILAEQECEARGAYCGALGWIGEGGLAMDLNVMIRTLTLDREGAGWRATGRSGGAITIDSDPEEEYAETLAKASALKKAITG